MTDLADRIEQERARIAAEKAVAERERVLLEQIELNRNTFRDCDIIDDPIGAAAQLEAAMRACDALLAKHGGKHD